MKVVKKVKSDTKHKEAVRRGKNAKRKGGQYERTIAQRFKERFGLDLKRTPQSGGFAKKSTKADDFRGDITLVDADKEFLLHCECKNCKTWSLPAWLSQAQGDCPRGRVPLVIFHKYNTGEDYVCLSLEDFFRLVDESKITAERKEQ